MKDTPTSADLLNGWLHTHFAVYQGPPRAYHEFTFPVQVGYEEEKAYCYSTHRIVHISLGFKGFEEDCCKALAEWLYMQVTYEEYYDACVPLFVRYLFRHEKEGTHEQVLGRLAFWDSSKNRRLIASPAYKPEGALLRSPVSPEGIWERR